MAVMMMVVGALTTIACVAVAAVPVRWLEVVRGRCGEHCVRIYKCCCRKERIRRERRDLGSMTELPNRSEEVEKIGDVCVEFRQTGACEFGDRCRFLHV